MAEEQVDLNLGKVSLTPTVQGGGRFSTVIPKTPTTNSALRLSSGLANFSTVLGQYSNIQIKRGEEKAAAMSTEDVISAMENQQKGAGIPITERIGFQRGYSEGLYSRYLEAKTIPRLNELSLELANLNADEIDAKDINEFDTFLQGKIKEVEDEALQYVDGNPFQMMIHGSVFDPVKTKFAIQERSKFAEKQNAWSVAREEELAGTGFIDLLNTMPALEKDGTQDLTRLLPDEINRIIGGFEQKGLALNIPAGSKPKMLHRSLLRAVRTFVNDPTGIRADKFDQARDFLEAATKSGTGKFKVFSSLSGKEAISQAYTAIDSAERAFTAKNETFSKESIEGNSVYQAKMKLVNEQDLGLAEGDPLDTLDFYKDNALDLAEEMGGLNDREFNLLTGFLNDRYDEMSKQREGEIAFMMQDYGVGNKFTAQNNPNALIRRLYDSSTIESTGADPLFTTYSIPGPFGIESGTIQVPTTIVAKELQPFITDSLTNLDETTKPQIRAVLKDRSLSEEEKKAAVKDISDKAYDAEVTALENKVKAYVEETFLKTKPVTSAEAEREKAIKELAKEKALTEEQAEKLLSSQIASESEEEVFKSNKDGDLNPDYFNVDSLSGVSAGRQSIFDVHVSKYNTVLQNTQNKGLLLGKPEVVDKAFNNLRILRQNNVQGLRSRASEMIRKDGLFQKAPDATRKIQLEGQMNDILSGQGGLTEGEAIEGFVQVEVPQPKLSFLGRGAETVQYRHAVKRLVNAKFRDIPILRLNTINKFNSKDQKAVDRVNRIINTNKIKIEGKIITAQEFVEAQQGVYDRATQPLVLPTTD